MAHGTSETDATTETCQIQQAYRNAQPSSGPSRPRSNGREATAVETNWKEEGPVKKGQELSNESEPKQNVTAPRSDFTLLLESCHLKNDSKSFGEATAMFESPAGGSPKASSSHDQAKDKSRRVTYASFTASPPHSEKGLLRRDSSYYSSKDMESEGSEVDFAIQAKQLRAWERIVIHRQRVQRTRRLIRSCRERVHEFRDEVRDIVDLLARRFNERKTLERQFEDSIEELYDKLQTARDKLGPTEDEYDNLERRLESEEDDLEEEEESFYSHHDLFNIVVPESRLDIPLSPISEPSRPLDSDPDDLIFEHELVQKYLKQLEKAEELKEDMDQLENEYLEVSEKVTFRRKHHIPLSEESTTFLYEEYPKFHAEIMKDLRAAEDALFETRDACIEEKLFTAADHKYERWDTLCDDLMDLVDEARDRSPIRAAAHSLDYNDRAADFGDKKDYVNKWILQWIEDSTVGTMLLQAWIYFEYPDGTNKDEELGDEKWSALAVENWDTDTAGDMANKNNRDSRLDAITGVAPARTVKPHDSTARSVFSSSMGTLNVLPDIESDSAFREILRTPTFHEQQRYEDLNENIPSTDSSPKIISQSKSPDQGLEILSKAAPAEQDVIKYTADKFSTSLQSMSIDSIGEDSPSQSSCPYTETRSNSLSTACHSEDEIRHFTTVTAGAIEQLPKNEGPSLEYQDDLTDTPRRLPVCDADKDISIPYMALISAPEEIQDQAATSSPQNMPPKSTEDTVPSPRTLDPSLEETTPPSTLLSSRSFPNLKIAPVSSSTITERLDETPALQSPIHSPPHSPMHSPIPTITTTVPPPAYSQSFPLPRPTPTSTLSPPQITRQRAKSESRSQARSPSTPRRANSPLPERDRNAFLTSPPQIIRHRRSLSPTSLLRRIENFGFGSWRHGDLL